MKVKHFYMYKSSEKVTMDHLILDPEAHVLLDPEAHVLSKLIWPISADFWRHYVKIRVF